MTTDHGRWTMDRCTDGSATRLYVDGRIADPSVRALRTVMNSELETFSLTERSVLITGASGSIGQAIVRAFAAAGASVALHYHQRRDAAEELLRSLPGTGHVLVPADIAHPADVHRMVDEVVSTYGRLDVLVNNAA